MSASTKIQWTDRTWNPISGCTHISPGCDNCYAEKIAERFRGTPAFPEGFDVTLHPERLEQPLRWRARQRVFVNSMSDLFHEQIPREFIARVFATMSEAKEQTFQVLTKRQRIMRSMLLDPEFVAEVDNWRGEAAGDFCWPLPNVWMGVSVENDRYARIRIPRLLDTPAAVRFLSIEPLVGRVELWPWLDRGPGEPRIDWVIIGGESGPNARPMKLAWATEIVAECAAAGVAVFVKQLGTASASAASHHDLATFPTDLQVRQFPA